MLRDALPSFLDMGVYDKARKVMEVPVKWKSRTNKFGLTLSRSVSKTSLGASSSVEEVNTTVQSTSRLPKLNKNITAEKNRKSRFKDKNFPLEKTIEIIPSRQGSVFASKKDMLRSWTEAKNSNTNSDDGNSILDQIGSKIEVKD